MAPPLDSRSPSRWIRGRMLGVLAVLLAVNTVFVVALLWGFGVLIPTAVSAVVTGETTVLWDLVRLPVSAWMLVVIVAGFLGGGVYYGYRRVLETEPIDEGADHGIERTVRRLAMAADVPEPSVRVLEDETPSCYTVGRFTDATIVLTTGVIDALDADELAAVLAHEIAHIANRDVTLMTVTTLFLEATARVHHATRLIGRAISDPGGLSDRDRIVLRFGFPLALLVYLLVAPILWVFPRIADWATRTLSFEREYAADAAAAHIVGRPLALATALLTLSDSTELPTTDLRRARTAALCIVPSEPASGSETVSRPAITRPARAQARRDRVEAVLADRPTGQPTETHPPVEQRVAHLREIAAEIEGR